MFEELDLKVTDATKSLDLIIRGPYNTSKAICSETSGKYCC